jgi:hypothetical protein
MDVSPKLVNSRDNRARARVAAQQERLPLEMMTPTAPRAVAASLIRSGAPIIHFATRTVHREPAAGAMSRAAVAGPGPRVDVHFDSIAHVRHVAQFIPGLFRPGRGVACPV